MMLRKEIIYFLGLTDNRNNCGISSVTVRVSYSQARWRVWVGMGEVPERATVWPRKPYFSN